MPQVFFNTDTFKPDAFPVLTEKDLQDMSDMAARAHPEMARKINRPWLLYKVPNFLEAFRDGFDGWHLHHLTGESVPRQTLLKARLYDNRPWWEFRFLREADHFRLHGECKISVTGAVGQ